MIHVQPVSPHIGADAPSYELRALLEISDADAIEAIWKLVRSFKVLRFTKQKLTPHELVRLAELFGSVRALKRRKGFAHHIQDCPQIKVVSNVTANGEATGDGGSSENAWHTDGSYLPRPTALTFLYGRKAPTRNAPKTYFLDMQKVYDELPAQLIARICGRRAIHYSPVAYAPEYAAEIEALDEDADRRHIGPRHPLIRRDPATGRPSLFPPRQRECLIEGLSVSESEALADALWSAIETAEQVWGCTVEADDLMLFDNRFTLHRREPFDTDEERTLWHVTTDGEMPQ